MRPTHVHRTFREIDYLAGFAGTTDREADREVFGFDFGSFSVCKEIPTETDRQFG